MNEYARGGTKKKDGQEYSNDTYMAGRADRQTDRQAERSRARPFDSRP